MTAQLRLRDGKLKIAFICKTNFCFRSTDCSYVTIQKYAYYDDSNRDLGIAEVDVYLYCEMPDEASPSSGTSNDDDCALAEAAEGPWIG